jgi:hypothetical protein
MNPIFDGMTVAEIESKFPRSVMWCPDHLGPREREEFCYHLNVLIEGGGNRLVNEDGVILGWFPNAHLPKFKATANSQ